MALIKCKSCGKEISDKAMECVYCKAKIREDVNEPIENKKTVNNNELLKLIQIGNIAVFIITGFIVIFVCYFIFKNDKINGCYSTETLKICINGDKVIMSTDEDDVTYYSNYVGKTVFIETEYGRQLGYCERVRDSKNIYCVFNGIGSEFKKQ